MSFSPKLAITSLLLCLTFAVRAQSNSNIRFISDTTCNFESLINRFKGKVIFVNVWATWCYPCRLDLMSKKDVKPFEAFAAKNDVVILYICADKTDGPKWRAFVNANQLHGYHIWMNKIINEEMHTTLAEKKKGRDGDITRHLFLPRHMVIDKQGNIVDTVTYYTENNPVLYTRLKQLF